MTVLRELLLDSRDGEWGKGEPFDGGHWSSVIRGTDFAGARMGEVSNIPNRVLEDRHLRRKMLAPNDILIETAGGTKDQPTGRTLYITERLLNVLPHPAVCASFARFLRIDATKADPGYIFWLLQDHYHRRELLRFHTQHTGVARFQFTTFADTYEFQLPSPEVQRSVADMLFAYDDLIEINERRTAILEDMAQRLFDEWFVRFRYPGHETVPLVETELGMVPEGWWLGTFRECAEVNPETLSPRHAPHEINYIDISSVSVGRVDAVATMEFSQAPGRARRIVRDGDVIWSTVRPNRRSHALLLDVAPNTIASTGFAALRSRNSDWAWMYEATRTDSFVGFLVGRARGSAYPAVVGADFEDVPLIVPPVDLRVKFQTQVGPMHELASTLHRQNNKLRAARDLLLPKLISGEINVSVVAETFAEAAE